MLLFVFGLVLSFVQSQAEAPQMTTGGWIFMLGAWTAIISLAAFCFSKVLRKRKK